MRFVGRWSQTGALRGVACYRLTVGYAACAAALGAAAAAAAAAGLEDAGEVRLTELGIRRRIRLTVFHWDDIHAPGFGMTAGS